MVHFMVASKVDRYNALRRAWSLGKKDAEAAANYMDLQAGLITEKEYEKTCEGTMEVKVGGRREMER